MDRKRKRSKSAPTPLAKQAKLACPINELPDDLLLEIFKRLSPGERLLTSEVCRRWHKLSLVPWIDVKCLDLTELECEHIGAVVKQCPNLQAVRATDRRLGNLSGLSVVLGLTSVKFYGCDLAMNDEVTVDVFQSVFSDQIDHAAWLELVLHEIDFGVAPDDSDDDDVGIVYRPCPKFSRRQSILSLAHFPASLKRLQITYPRVRMLEYDVQRLEQLECLILQTVTLRQNASLRDEHGSGQAAAFQRIASLKNLKELCLYKVGADMHAFDFIRNLPKLEVLFLCKVHVDELGEELTDLVTRNSTLRILVLAGEFFAGKEQIEIPKRKRFPNGLGGEPLPLLQIFLSNEASQRICFADAASSTIRVRPIDQPMPRFLERPDIAPIFEGVWVAEQIKETAKYGGELWNYEKHDCAKSVQLL